MLREIRLARRSALVDHVAHHRMPHLKTIKAFEFHDSKAHKPGEYLRKHGGHRHTSSSGFGVSVQSPSLSGGSGK